MKKKQLIFDQEEKTLYLKHINYYKFILINEAYREKWCIFNSLWIVCYVILSCKFQHKLNIF